MQTSDIYKTLQTIEDAVRSLPVQYLDPMKSIIASVVAELTQDAPTVKPRKPRKDGDNA